MLGNLIRVRLQQGNLVIGQVVLIEIRDLCGCVCVLVSCSWGRTALAQARTSSKSWRPRSLYRSRVGSVLGPVLGWNCDRMSSFRLISTALRRMSIMSMAVWPVLLMSFPLVFRENDNAPLGGAGDISAVGIPSAWLVYLDLRMSTRVQALLRPTKRPAGDLSQRRQTLEVIQMIQMIQMEKSGCAINSGETEVSCRRCEVCGRAASN